LLGNPTINLTGFSGHLNVALYDSDGDNNSWDPVPTSGNQPGTLLATCTAITNPTTGDNTLTWVSAPTIQNGHSYFLAFWSDTTFTVSDNGSGSAWQSALAYTGTFPTSVQNTGSVQSQGPQLHATITPTNSGMINDQTQDGATTYNSSNTVSQKDTFGVNPLPFTPGAVLGVDVFILCAKSDAGSRSIQAGIKSGGTEIDYTALNPNTSFNYAYYAQDTDPNTGLAWTPVAINNMSLIELLAA
jgi:hypothetical protein